MKIVRLIMFSSLMLICLAVNSYAQDPTIEDVIVDYRQAFVDVTFSEIVFDVNDANLDPKNIEIRGKQTNKLVPALLVQGTGDVSQLRIRIPNNFNLDADVQISISFKELFFKKADGKEIRAENLSAEGIIQKTAADARVEQQKVLEELKKVPKVSSEKNIFASGFVANGSGSDAEGGAEIHLNSNDLGIPGLFASLHLLKSTAEGADPKHFDAALTYRFTRVSGAETLTQIRQQLVIARTASDPTERKNALIKVKELTDSFHGKKIGAYILDLSTRLEGQALNFDITNFIGEGTFAIQSRTIQIGRSQWSYKFRFLGGLEIGQNLNNGSEAMQMMGNAEQASELEKVDWVARFKAGGLFNLFYSNPETSFLFKRVEINLGAVERYLFRSEVMFDNETMMNVTTDKGSKPWYQGDLRFYISDDSSKGRFGFKITFNRGSLPPVFAFNRSFQFGFIIESADDAK